MAAAVSERKEEWKNILARKYDYISQIEELNNNGCIKPDLPWVKELAGNLRSHPNSSDNYIKDKSTHTQYLTGIKN